MTGELERDFREFRETGEPRAMGRVFDRAAPELLLVAGHLANDASGAEDLVQETLLVAIEHRERFDRARRLMPWLLGILVRLHRSERRRRTASSIPEGWPAADRDPSDDAQDAELAARLDEALESLPSSYREPLRLRVIHGLEPVQIARALGRPLETVRTQLRRGRKRLRDALPASLVAALPWDFGLGSEGLSAIRDVVLARAAATPAATAALTALGGTLAMKKTLVVLVVLVIAWGGLLLLRGSAPASDLPEAPAAPEAPVALEEVRLPAELDSDPEERRVALAAATEDGPTTLTCRVVWDEDGSPAAGVAVRFSTEAQGELGPDRIATTADEGTVFFDDVTPGRAWLGGDRGGLIETELTAGQDHETELRIPSGLLVRGIVHDQRDQPVEGAQVWVSGTTGSTYYGTYSSRTGPDGRFELHHVEPRRVIGARLAGFAAAEPIYLLGEAGEEVEVTLQIGGKCAPIRGIVRGPDGEPRSDAVVFVGSATHHMRWTTGGRLLGATPPEWVYTDTDGTFEAEWPVGENVPIWARAPDTTVWHEIVEVSEPETWVEIDLASAALVTGRVLDLAGRPVRGVDVRALQEGIDPGYSMAFVGPWWAVPMAATDAGGEFRLNNVRPGHATIVANGRDQGEIAKTLELSGGEETTIELVLGGAPTIGGMVVDEHDQPLAGIQIDGQAEVGGNHNLSQVRSGTDGRFELVDCSRERYTLYLRDPQADVNPTVQEYGVVPGGQPVRIVFPSTERASSRIVGTLVMSDGAPVEATRVSLDRFGPDGAIQWAGHRTSLENGFLRTALLPAGRYLITVRGEATGTWTLDEVDLPPNTELDLGEIQAAAPGRIELVLEGVFEPDMKVFIHVEGSPWAMSFELRDGRGTSELLHPGSYWVGFSGYSAPLMKEEVEVRAGETTTVVQSLGAGVSRKVRTPRVPVDGLFLEQTWMDGDGFVLSKGGWGVQRREADTPHPRLLLPGSYRVVVTARDGRSAETTFEVTKDPESDEVIELPSPVMD